MFKGTGALMLYLCALVGAVDHLATVKVTPVQKVIQLLEDMVAKGTAEKQAEEAQFAAYTQFCQVTSDAKKKAIKKATALIETLEADIAKYEAEVDTLAQEIAVLDVDINTWEGDTKSTTRVREIEQKDYDKTYADFSESIDALAEGKANIEAQQGKVAQAGGGAAAFAQIQKSKLVPAQAKKAIAAFLEMSSPNEADESADLSIVAPELSTKALNAFIQHKQDPEGEANAYESQSKGVLDMLEGLSDKFFKKRADLEAEEISQIRAYDKLQLDFKNNLDGARTFRDEKKAAKAKLLQHAADAKGDLADTTSTR
jgi:hypothetical protein